LIFIIFCFGKIKLSLKVAQNIYNFEGLSAQEVITSREKNGQNILKYKKEHTFFEALKKIFQEPMIILLLVASSVYFISGKTGDGLFMLVAIVFQISISLYQDNRSKHALDKLKNFTQPSCKVIREGIVVSIKNTELVIGDYLVVEEGHAITADGIIVQSNDFSVNESILTGESMAVLKDVNTEDPMIYSGTIVSTGSAIAQITAIGNATRLGKIGLSLASIKEENTPLEIQINHFVKKMALIGTLVFIVFWGINYLHSQHVLNSLLQSLTLAMSILPEEIPVAFTTFMALGAWRLMKMGIVVKQMKTVETLGSATVICTDKTGTITENNMSLAKLFVLKNNATLNPNEPFDEATTALVKMAMLASEPAPFDPMEIALHQLYEKTSAVDERTQYRMIHEYPLSGTPPMMTHLYDDQQGKRIIAAKGAPEALGQVSHLSSIEKEQIAIALQNLTQQGYRVLSVGEAKYEGNDFPSTQQTFSFQYLGLLAFYDPPKKNMQEVLNHFYDAGISVKIITGDNAETTQSIARQIGFKGYDQSISGVELMALTDEALHDKVMQCNVFTRMFPEAKLQIINALKARHQIVAMTGDGVNDGPALKAAHIGIAMGKKGTEIAKEAASLILLDDDLSKMVDAIAMGRKIYANLKKAIQYIISIHVPIIMTVLIPVSLGWIYPNIFSPVHVIFLEIIMGPTCSIVYENEPIEKNTMLIAPKPFTKTFFNWKELSISIFQGLIISVGTLMTYQYAVAQSYNEAHTRTMVFAMLIVANIFLTLINRSFYYSIFTTLRYKNHMVPLIILATVCLVALLVYIPLLSRFFAFEKLPLHDLGIVIAIGIASVSWFELVKLYKRSSHQSGQ